MPLTRCSSDAKMPPNAMPSTTSTIPMSAIYLTAAVVFSLRVTS